MRAACHCQGDIVTYEEKEAAMQLSWTNWKNKTFEFSLLGAGGRCCQPFRCMGFLRWCSDQRLARALPCPPISRKDRMGKGKVEATRVKIVKEGSKKKKGGGRDCQLLATSCKSK
eukprot:3534704-Amphidinium_carterae.1